MNCTDVEKEIDLYVAGRKEIYCLNGEEGMDIWHLPNRSETWFATKPLMAVGGDRLFVVTPAQNGKSRVQCIDTPARRSH